MSCGITGKTECCTKNCHKELEDEESEIDEYEDVKYGDGCDIDCLSTKTLLSQNNSKKYLK